MVFVGISGYRKIRSRLRGMVFFEKLGERNSRKTISLHDNLVMWGFQTGGKVRGKRCFGWFLDFDEAGCSQAEPGKYGTT
jgi:hypothetical protein